MIIKIKIQTTEEKEIDIEFPFYYRTVFNEYYPSETISVSKIFQDGGKFNIITIEYKFDSDGGRTYSLEKEENINLNSYYSYIKDSWDHSDFEGFEEMKKDFLEFCKF